MFFIQDRLADKRTGHQLTDKSKITEIEHVSSAIGDINRIDIELRDLEKAVDQFFKSDLQLLCFLVEDKTERYKAARYVLDKSGVSVGKEKAKVWLTEQERKIKAELNVEKIKIHG